MKLLLLLPVLLVIGFAGTANAASRWDAENLPQTPAENADLALSIVKDAYKQHAKPTKMRKSSLESAYYAVWRQGAGSTNQTSECISSWTMVDRVLQRVLKSTKGVREASVVKMIGSYETTCSLA
jgi:hypothetical protein